MTVKDQQEQLRLELRAKAQTSTYFMAKSVLGFHDIVPGTHKPMCDFIDHPAKRKLGMAPRDHLKTSCWTIANCVKLVAANPNIRILLANETATNAAHFLRRIQSVFTRNVYFQWLFPELVQDVSKTKWNEQEMLVPRSEDHPESTIEVIGVGGAVVSRHFDHIKLDDLVGKEASESPVVMQKTIDWYLLCESLLVHPTQSAIDLYGTRWAYNDVYSYAEEHEGDYLHMYIIDAEEDENGNPRAFWPERFPLEVLEQIKKKMGPFKYSCQYKNAPHDPEGGSFRKEWLRYYSFDDEGNCRTELGATSPISKLRKTMRVDPAISQGREACRTAIVVDGIDELGRIFLLETWAERCEPSKMWDKIFEFQRKWEPEKVGIESVAYQKVLQYNAQDEMSKRKQFINVCELRPTPKQSKPGRILGVQPYFRRGEVFILRSDEDFEHEYTGFPVAKTCDILDIFAYGPQVWEPPELDDELEDEGYGWDQQMESLGRNSLTGY